MLDQDKLYFLEKGKYVEAVLDPSKRYMQSGRVVREYTNQENEARDAEEAAYEIIRLDDLKAMGIQKSIQAMAPMLTQEFLSLTEAEQVEFANDFDAVEKRLNKGDVVFSRAIIAAKKPQTENGLEVQGRLLAGLDSVINLMG